MSYDMHLQRCDKVEDLGVIIDSNLTFENHHHFTEKVNKAYSVLGIIKRNFEHIRKDALFYYRAMHVYSDSAVLLS